MMYACQDNLQNKLDKLDDYDHMIPYLLPLAFGSITLTHL